VLEPAPVTSITFLGTGDYLASERYWNGFVVDRHILVEPSPAVLPHLRRCGIDAAELDVVVVSHFHADHTFGWPFLLLELLRRKGSAPVSVIGPPGVQGRLAAMMELGGVEGVSSEAHRRLDLRYVEVDESWQDAGTVSVRAVEVDHVPYLRCFGFLLDLGDRILGYSGDTRPCPGLDTLAGACDPLVLECNGAHPPGGVHMTVEDVAALRGRFPGLSLVLTHLGPGVDASSIDNCVVPNDFQTIDI